MNTGPRQRLATAFVAVLMLAAVVTTSSEYLNLRIGADDPYRNIERLAASQPWGGLAAQESARLIGSRWRQDPARALAALDWHLARYPLDAQGWLDRARVNHFLGADSDTFRLDLASARAVHPASRDFGWQAINLAQHVADADTVAEQVRLWLAGQPNAVQQGLFMAGRWVPDPAERIARVLPEGEEYLLAAMRYARMNMLPAMAEAVWLRLPQPRPDDDPALADYLRILTDSGDTAGMVRLRQGLDDEFRHGDIPGGSLRGDLAWLDTMGWDLRVPGSVTLALQALDMPGLPAAMRETGPTQALVLEFDGSDNINLRAPWVRFSVPAPGSWRLQGWWEAEQLTTRSLPALQLRSLATRQRHNAAVPSASFGWQDFALEIEVEQADEMLELRVIRSATNAFDRNIAGVLRLAGLRFTPVEAENELDQEHALP